MRGAGMCGAGVQESKSPDALSTHKVTNQESTELKQSDNKSETLADTATSGLSPKFFVFFLKRGEREKGGGMGGARES